MNVGYSSALPTCVIHSSSTCTRVSRPSNTCALSWSIPAEAILCCTFIVMYFPKVVLCKLFWYRRNVVEPTADCNLVPAPKPWSLLSNYGTSLFIASSPDEGAESDSYVLATTRRYTHTLTLSDHMHVMRVVRYLYAAGQWWCQNFLERLSLLWQRLLWNDMTG